MRKYRVMLLAEDNPKDVELTLEALGEHNLANNVIVVNDGVEVIDYLRCEGRFTEREPEKPILILMDIKMPRMDGLEALRVIKQDPALKTIPIVMLTATRESPEIQSCYDLGANAFVVKPVDFKQFVDVVKKIGVFWALLNEPSIE